VKGKSDMNKKYIFDYPNQSIEPYLQLLTNNYLPGKLEIDLMQNYVDINGSRYASDPDYEIKLQSKYKFIEENTKIQEYHSMMRNYAIKCNR
jgi:flagellum-specific peptidoglycan hydrolase FlgJ